MPLTPNAAIIGWAKVLAVAQCDAMFSQQRNNVAMMDVRNIKRQQAGAKTAETAKAWQLRQPLLSLVS